MNSRDRSHPLSGKRRAQGQNGRPRQIQLLSYGVVGQALICEQHDTGTEHHSLGRIAVSEQCLYLSLLVIVQHKRGRWNEHALVYNVPPRL